MKPRDRIIFLWQEQERWYQKIKCQIELEGKLCFEIAFDKLRLTADKLRLTF
jgi:hypothetical protein